MVRRNVSRRADSATKRVHKDPDVTRAALIASAVQLFEEQGYDATSVQEIVDAAERTKGAFYHYFQSKEDVLHDIHDRFIDYQLDLAHKVLARDEPEDVLLTDFITEVLMEPLGIYKSEVSVFLQEHRFLSEDAFDEIRAKRDEFDRCLVQLIQRGIKSGKFKALGTPRVLAFGVIGMCAWSYTWLDLTGRGRSTPREIGEMFSEIVVAGLRA